MNRILWGLALTLTLLRAHADPIYLVPTIFRGISVPGPAYKYPVYEYSPSGATLARKYEGFSKHELDSIVVTSGGYAGQGPSVFGIVRSSGRVEVITAPGNSGTAGQCSSSPVVALTAFSATEVLAIAADYSIQKIQQNGTCTVYVSPGWHLSLHPRHPHPKVRAIQRIDQHLLAVLTERELVLFNTMQNSVTHHILLGPANSLGAGIGAPRAFIATWKGAWLADAQVHLVPHLVYLDFTNGVGARVPQTVTLSNISLLDIDPNTQALRLRWGDEDRRIDARTGAMSAFAPDRFSYAVLRAIDAGFPTYSEIAVDAPRTGTIGMNRHQAVTTSIWGCSAKAVPGSAPVAAPVAAPTTNVPAFDAVTELREALARVRTSAAPGLPATIGAFVPAHVLRTIVANDEPIRLLVVGPSKIEIEQKLLAKANAAAASGPRPAARYQMKPVAALPDYDTYLTQNNLTNPDAAFDTFLRSYHLVRRYGLLEVDFGHDFDDIPVADLAEHLNAYHELERKLSCLLSIAG